MHDIKTKEALPGATIYLDGTTLGTTSDFEGYFNLDIEQSQNANVIISFVGYDTKVIPQSAFENDMPIYLTESTNQLNEVELGLDIWSREKKIGIFKREFLGKEYSSTQCKIINEKDIVLIHNDALNTLTAYSDKPIIIRNKHLGYEVSYNLLDFEIEFIYNLQGLYMPNKVYYAGTSYYKDLKKRTNKKILANRIQEYYGSLIHFMRSLSTAKLVENHFAIFHDRFPVSPYKFFKISEESNLTKVTLNTKSLSILYNKTDQSSIELTQKDNTTFYIDKTGNHSPPDALIFGGYIGQKRMSSTLPLNFKLSTEIQPITN